MAENSKTELTNHTGDLSRDCTEAHEGCDTKKWNDYADWSPSKSRRHIKNTSQLIEEFKLSISKIKQY